MDSPRSEKSISRFSTPVSDLDDHRFQPSSLPRADAAGSRRGTAGTMAGGEVPAVRLDLQQLNRVFNSTVDEEAVVDDDDSSSSESVQHVRMASTHSPIAARRETFMRARHRTLSKGSVDSNRSLSPPNSVDAFAGHRRRAGTLDSKAPSDLDVPLHRTISHETHHRQPTFSEPNPNGTEGRDDAMSRHVSAEEDVCFPPNEETMRSSNIDFEELEEFVATQAYDRRASESRRKYSMSSQGRRPKILLNENSRIYGQVNGHGVMSPVDVVAPVDSADLSLAEKEGQLLPEQSSLSDARTIAPEVNRFSFFSSELDSTIHAPDLGDLVMPGESFRDLFELGPEGGVWWLDMLNPSEEEVNAISRAFSIHPLTSEDIKTQETREKVELFKQYYFVCFRSFYQVDKKSDNFMEPVNVYIVVFREGVLSFTFRSSPHASSVRKRIGKLRDYLALSADWICYALIDDIVDSFGPVIHDIERETDVIEDSVFVSRADDFSLLLRQIGDCRKKVMGLMRLLGGKADVIKGFAKRCNEQYSVTPRGEIGLYLGDIQDHVVTMMSNLGHSEKMLSRSHSNYLAQLSVDNIERGNRANEVLSKITLVATILVPLNLITGLFGMNVPVPGEGSGGLHWFFGIIGVIACTVLCALGLLRRLRYI